jgi:magnesium chelatase family protein
VITGELSLEGYARPITGAISIAHMARDKGFTHLYLPAGNIEEASLIDGIALYPVTSLGELVLHLNAEKPIKPYIRSTRDLALLEEFDYDFAEVRGQFQAKRALEIAAAGFHNVHLKGSPGAGKTMLSKAFVSIIPPMTNEEVLEVTKLYSVAGLTHKRTIMANRPFRSPHHTTSRVGLVGGGSIPMPGEISLSHRGVLFLDEFAEFPRSVIEALRQPMEDGVVTVSRAAGSLTFPARFILVAASNPCPCGYLGHPKRTCKCLPGTIIKYKKRLSGPILDRIDLHIDVPPVDETELTGGGPPAESSAAIRSRIIAARHKQEERFKNLSILSNSEMRPVDIKSLCPISNEGLTLLKTAISRLTLSARSYFKIIKVSRTIADLENSERIESGHIAEALQYRAKED